MNNTRLSYTNKLWHTRGEREGSESLFEAILRIRKLEKKAYIRKPNLDALADGMRLPGMTEAIPRLKKAIEKKEKILLFGDFDLDGASGVALIYLALKHLGLEVIPRLPSREDGYGLSKKAFEEAEKQGASLVMSIDCGVSNGAEIAFGQSLGIDTIVADHHSIPRELPDAIIVHPHLEEKPDDLWDLTGAGVAFFIAKELLQEVLPEKNQKGFLFQLLELACLGTIADVGSLQGQNRILVILGLEQMKKTSHPGIKKLLEMAKIDRYNLAAESIAFFLAPRLNASGRLDHPHTSLRLLLGHEDSAYELEKLNTRRQEITEELTLMAHGHVVEEDLFHCIFHEDFFSGVSGLIASKIAEKHNKPTIVLAKSKEKDMMVASCRGPDDFHFKEALEEVEHLLRSFGGHQKAAGFSLPQKNVPAFRKAFGEVVLRRRGASPRAPHIYYDLAIDKSFLRVSSIRPLERLAPFGEGNPHPLFCLQSIELSDLRLIGKKKNHLSGKLPGGITFVAFFMGEHKPQIESDKLVDILVEPEERFWRGRKELRVKIVDIRSAQAA